MAKAEFPTQEMIDTVDAEISGLKVGYLPQEGKRVGGEVVGVKELQEVVGRDLEYIKGSLIPQLKKARSDLQKRNTWLECQARNKYQNAQFAAENDKVRALIDQETEKTIRGKDAANNYPQVIMDAVKTRSLEYEKEILSVLGDLQTKKHAKVEAELVPIVKDTVKKYEAQSGALSHAQKLRQLQGVLQQELLASGAPVVKSRLAEDIGLTNDAVVRSIIEQPAYDEGQSASLK